MKRILLGKPGRTIFGMKYTGWRMKSILFSWLWKTGYTDIITITAYLGRCIPQKGEKGQNGACPFRNKPWGGGKSAGMAAKFMKSGWMALFLLKIGNKFEKWMCEYCRQNDKNRL